MGWTGQVFCFCLLRSLLCLLHSFNSRIYLDEKFQDSLTHSQSADPLPGSLPTSPHGLSSVFPARWSQAVFWEGKSASCKGWGPGSGTCVMSFLSLFFLDKANHRPDRLKGLEAESYLLMGGAAEHLWPYLVCFGFLVNPPFILSDLISPLKY